MCKALSLIHTKSRDVDDAAIADSMERYLARQDDRARSISADAVNKIFGGSRGIKLDMLPAFLNAIGLKIVDADDCVIPQDEYEAMRIFARKYINSDQD